MKQLFLTLTLIMNVFVASEVSATAWPTVLGNLPQKELAKVEYKQLYGFSVYDFKYISEDSTVGAHAIVMYGIENVLVTCDDGIVDKDNYYLLLYVDGDSIKHVTNFSNYGCRKN